jgi:hypothetical protein
MKQFAKKVSKKNDVKGYWCDVACYAICNGSCSTTCKGSCISGCAESCVGTCKNSSTIWIWG